RRHHGREQRDRGRAGAAALGSGAPAGARRAPVGGAGGRGRAVWTGDARRGYRRPPAGRRRAPARPGARQTGADRRVDQQRGTGHRAAGDGPHLRGRRRDDGRQPQVGALRHADDHPPLHGDRRRAPHQRLLLPQPGSARHHPLRLQRLQGGAQLVDGQPAHGSPAGVPQHPRFGRHAGSRHHGFRQQFPGRRPTGATPSGSDEAAVRRRGGRRHRKPDREPGARDLYEPGLGGYRPPLLRRRSGLRSRHGTDVAMTSDQPAGALRSDAQTGLRRRVGLGGAAALIIGNTVGVGIFLTPAGMARGLASPTLLFLVWAFMGGTALCGALCFGELAARFPEAGGGYVYLREAYGPGVAFLYGWKCLLVMDPGLTAALATGLGAYAQAVVPGISPKAVAFVGIGVVAATNWVGVRLAAGIGHGLAVAKVGILLLLVAWGFLSGAGDAWH